jgi:hypothetical protein
MTSNSKPRLNERADSIKKYSDLTDEWESAYGESFFTDGPIYSIYENKPEIASILDDLEYMDNKKTIRKTEKNLIKMLVENNINLIDIIEDNIEGPNEDGYQYGGDIEMQEYLNKLKEK